MLAPVWSIVKDEIPDGAVPFPFSGMNGMLAKRESKPVMGLTKNGVPRIDKIVTFRVIWHPYQVIPL